MPTSEFEKKIHRWASLICCFGSYRCLVRVGSICNLLELDMQIPGWGWKHLQFAGIGFADAWPGLEASATCWNWICRCLVGVGSICNLLDMNLQIHILGSEASATCWNWICRCLVRVGSICNLLELDLQMPITKLILRILQQLRWDCFLCRKKSKMFSWTCGAYCAKI